MSFTMVCPWCQESYTTGMVGRRVIGTRHRCQQQVDCQQPDCDQDSVFCVEQSDDILLVCSDHTKGTTILSSKPGAWK